MVHNDSADVYLEQIVLLWSKMNEGVIKKYLGAEGVGVHL